MGLNVDNGTTAVAAQCPGRDEPEYRGLLQSKHPVAASGPQAGRACGQRSSSCCHAGPCGYGVHRKITEIGHGYQIRGAQPDLVQTGGPGADGSPRPAQLAVTSLYVYGAYIQSLPAGRYRLRAGHESRSRQDRVFDRSATA